MESLVRFSRTNRRNSSRSCSRASPQVDLRAAEDSADPTDAADAADRVVSVAAVPADPVGSAPAVPVDRVDRAVSRAVVSGRRVEDRAVSGRGEANSFAPIATPRTTPVSSAGI